MKKLEYFRILPALLAVVLSIFIGMTIWYVNQLQGTARVVNYAGIARGATQRLVKLELVNKKQPELEEKLDVLLQELKDGGKINYLIKVDDPYYQNCLERQTAFWQEVKKDIATVRQSGDYQSSRLLAKSETYFVLADTTVGAAERYVEYLTKIIAFCEYVIVALLVLLLIFSVHLYRVTLKLSQERELLVRHQAEHDAMTELLNRRSFDTMMHFHETMGVPFTLVLMDVDNFKNYNDNFGHATGDAVLKRVAETLRASCRQDDHVCRIGGDEFAIIIEGLQSENKAVVDQKMETIRQCLAYSADESLKVTMSIGIAFSDCVPRGETVFNAADRALYQVKVTGRDGFAYYGLE